MLALYSPILQILFHKCPYFFCTTHCKGKEWEGTSLLNRFDSLALYFYGINVYLIIQTETFIIFLELLHLCFCCLRCFKYNCLTLWSWVWLIKDTEVLRFSTVTQKNHLLQNRLLLSGQLCRSDRTQHHCKHVFNVCLFPPKEIHVGRCKGM